MHVILIFFFIGYIFLINPNKSSSSSTSNQTLNMFTYSTLQSSLTLITHDLKRRSSSELLDTRSNLTNENNISSSINTLPGVDQSHAYSLMKDRSSTYEKE